MWLLAAALLQVPNSNTCVPQLVAAASGENYVMFRGASPDGRTLAIGWDRGVGAAIHRGAFLLNLSTGRRTDLPKLNNAPSFSPDGRFIVAANYPGDQALKTEIVELDTRARHARTYASNPALEWLASYSPDGKAIVFNSTRSGTSDIYRVWRGDGRVERLTSDPRYEAHAQLIDRGRRLLFHRQTNGDNYDIVVRDLETGAERLVGATLAEEAYPAMSPNDGWIAFSASTGVGKQPNLFVMRRDGTQRRQLTAGRVKDAYAAWSRNGQWLYFVRFDEDGSKIYRLNFPRCLAK